MNQKDDLAKLREESKARADEGSERSPSWSFKTDPVFEGTMVRGKVVRANDKVTAIIIADQFGTDKRYTIWCGNFMLERMIDEIAPAPGALIVIEFLGAEPSTANPTRTFHNYSMAADKSDQEYWSEAYKAYNARDRAGAEAAKGGETPTTVGPDEAPF